jgi:hypothetical protein
MVAFIFGQEEPGIADVATSGMGGASNAGADGGAISGGDFSSGGNASDAIGVGNTVGHVAVSASDMANTLDGGFAVNAGAALSNAAAGGFNYADPSPLS